MIEHATTSADRNAKVKSSRQAVIRKKCENPRRRKRLEANPAKWLKWYLADAYTRPFEQAHNQIIDGAIEANETGGRFAVAAERGIGKSAVLWGLVLYLKLSGKQPFPVCVPWGADALKRAFRFWKNAICYNERIAADYPEQVAPFVHAKGISQRINTTTWADNGKPTGASIAIGEGLIVFPDSGGCIGGSTINGNVRGLNHPQPSGGILRPSLVMLDDVQDRKVAKSPMQVQDTAAMIDGDVAGCGQAGRDMPMFMACNCIKADDVSDHYLQSEDWQSLRIPCVSSWPEGWEEDEGECKKHWKEWHRIVLNKGDEKKYYKKNREVMTKGMVVTSPAVFVGSKSPDAFHGVMLNYHKMGHDAFMAERQQCPVDPFEVEGPYNLTAAAILAKIEKRPALHKPSWVVSVVASTDLNPSYAFSTVILGFGADQTCAVLWRGLYKVEIHGNKPTPEREAELYAALSAHGKQLAEMPVKIDTWAIDAGGTNFDTTIRFCYNAPKICGLLALPFTGRGTKFYKPNGKTAVKTALPREECHLCLDVKKGVHIQWIAWHADYWREVAQRAWLGEIGAPCGCSLYNADHAEFAAQVILERLMGKGDIGGDMVWNWHTQPGPHDYGDCMSQGYACAAYVGIGTGGVIIRKQRPKRKRVRHVNV